MVGNAFRALKKNLNNISVTTTGCAFAITFFKRTLLIGFLIDMQEAF